MGSSEENEVDERTLSEKREMMGCKSWLEVRKTEATNGICLSLPYNLTNKETKKNKETKENKEEEIKKDNVLRNTTFTMIAVIRMDGKNWPKKNQRAVLMRFVPNPTGSKDRGQASLYINNERRVIGQNSNVPKKETRKTEQHTKETWGTETKTQTKGETKRNTEKVKNLSNGVMQRGKFAVIVCVVTPASISSTSSILKSNMKIYVNGVLSSISSLVPQSMLMLNNTNIQLFGGGKKRESMGGNIQHLTLIRGYNINTDVHTRVKLNQLLSIPSFNRILIRDAQLDNNQKLAFDRTFDRRSPSVHMRRLGNVNNSISLYITPTAKRAHNVLKYSEQETRDLLLAKHLRLLKMTDLLQATTANGAFFPLTLFEQKQIVHQRGDFVRSLASNVNGKIKVQFLASQMDGNSRPYFLTQKGYNGDLGDIYIDIKTNSILESKKLIAKDKHILVENIELILHAGCTGCDFCTYDGEDLKDGDTFDMHNITERSVLSCVITNTKGSEASNSSSAPVPPSTTTNKNPPQPPPTETKLKHNVRFLSFTYTNSTSKNNAKDNEKDNEEKENQKDRVDTRSIPIQLRNGPHQIVSYDVVTINNETKSLIGLWNASHAEAMQLHLETFEDTFTDVCSFDYNDSYQVVDATSMQQKDDRDLSVIISELVNDEDDVQKNKIISDRLYPLLDMYDVSRPDVIIQLFLENMECDDIIVLINGDPSKTKAENKKILMAKVLEAQESLN